jgi:integrase
VPQTRLTDRWLKSHRPSAREEWNDDLVPGLVVRFGARGAVFYARYREGGKVVRQRLGIFPGLSLFDARAQARDILAARQRLERAPGAPRRGTFDDLAAAFVAHRTAHGEARIDEVDRILRTEISPAIGAKRASSIRPADVAVILDAVVARGAAAQANKIRSHLVRIFRFGMERDYCEGNPALVLRPPHKPKSRERVLTDDELAALWRFLELKHPTIRHLFRLLILTALRPGEGRLLTWVEVEPDLLRIPREKVKSRREHALPVPPAVVAILDAQRALGFEGENVFPSPRREPDPLHADSLSHLAADFGAALGFAWQPRDLRRTAATGMARLGVDRFVRKLILNHADPDVHGVYDRYRYHAEILDGLTKWSAFVVGLGQSRSPATQS